MTDKNQTASNISQPPATTTALPLSDLELYRLCQQYGQATLEARRKFLGLLPEVNRRRLWQKKGFSSVFEFAAKMAGISEEQVTAILRLERKIFDKPLLHAQLVNGEVSHNKIARVVSVATQENEQFWATQTFSLSKTALDTLVKDKKLLQNTLSGQTSMPEITGLSNITRATYTTASTKIVKLKNLTATRLHELQTKGIDIDFLINEMLDLREKELAREKETLARDQDRQAALFYEYTSRVIGPLPQKPRHIPAKIRKFLQKEQGTKCSIPTCYKTAQTIHHTRRFALTPNHDPRFLSPLCPEHHEIAHKIDLTYARKHFSVITNK